MKAVSAGVVLIQEIGGVTHVLLVKHKKGSEWGLPKGRLEVGETLQECAVREAYEETGFLVKINDKNPTLLSSDGKYKKSFYVFEAKILEGAAYVKGDDIEWSAWWPLSRLPNLIAYQASYIRSLNTKLTHVL